MIITEKNNNSNNAPESKSNTLSPRLIEVYQERHKGSHRHSYLLLEILLPTGVTVRFGREISPQEYMKVWRGLHFDTSWGAVWDAVGGFWVLTECDCEKAHFIFNGGAA